MNKKNAAAKAVLLICSIPLIFLCIYCGIKIHNFSTERETIKKDYSDINSIVYGLLSVDAWKDNIERIMADRIRDFQLTGEQRADLESEISNVLKQIILQTDSLVRSNHSLKGKLTTMAYKTFVNKGDLLQKTPLFSHAIVEEMLKPKNKEKLKNLVESKLHEYASQTYGDTTNAYRINPILTKYHSPDRADFNARSEERVEYLQNKTYKLTYLVLIIIVLFLLTWIVIRHRGELQKLFFGLSVTLALAVLLVGLTSPMIEIDARIKTIDFVLLGDHLQFNDQILFYQSKSILQVVKILLETKAIDSSIVGILILVFSIVFPISKLISTQLYLFGKEKIRKSKFIYFFAIQSGKWSMADVMVVAIFMAYVGFKGILDNQLAVMNFTTPSLRSISTNLTSLQPAFILFLSFVIYGLILSEILKRIQSGYKA